MWWKGKRIHRLVRVLVKERVVAPAPPLTQTVERETCHGGYIPQLKEEQEIWTPGLDLSVNLNGRSLHEKQTTPPETLTRHAPKANVTLYSLHSQ